MSQSPWWHPSEEDLGWDDPLPDVVVLSPDYSAELPLWGAGFGNIAWQFTKFSPGLLDRLAAWQQEFDDNYHYSYGWKSAAIRRQWVSQVESLAADVQAELGARASLVVELWGLES
jgi:hypothetical protein